MKLTNLFGETDDTRAVSPVIGVILMVAITVILAAVIGSFVLNLGGNVESAPQASINFDYDADNSELTIAHRGGDTINPGNVEIRLNGEASDIEVSEDGSNFKSSLSDVQSSFSAGNSVTVQGNDVDLSQGDTIDIVTVNGDRQNIIATYEIPE